MAKWGGKERRDWVPIWIIKWLHGTTREELLPEERSVWIDFICLAGLENGHITKRSISQLGRELNVTPELLEKCINKFIITGKIEDHPDRWVIKNWDEYQLNARFYKKINIPDTDGQLNPGSYSDSQREEERREDIREEKELTTKQVVSSGAISLFLSNFNSIVQNLPKAERLTERRREKISTRLKFQPDQEWWKDVFEKADNIHLPPNEKYPGGWSPSFDWLIENDLNPIKVHEGRYVQKRALTPGEKWLAVKEEQERREEKEHERRRQKEVPARDGKAADKPPIQYPPDRTSGDPPDK